MPRRLRMLAAPAVALALAAPAAAKDDAPMVDSDSPAGTEYQLPIDSARERAGGKPRESSGADGAAPLFGAGVEADGSAKTGRTAQRSGARGEGGAPAPRPAARARPDLGTSTPKTVRAQAPASDGGAGELVAIGGGAAGVLLIGGLAGLAWRRRTNGT